MASKAIYSVVAVLGIAGLSGAAWWYQNKAPARAASTRASQPAAGARPTVEAARVKVVKLVDDAQAVGSLRSRRSVVLRPEVSGRITQLNFTDGQRVRKGQVLVQLDDQLPLAQVQQSLAELSIAQANQKRNQELVAQNFVSQRSLDESAANLQVAQARLSLARATAARLKIVAPFDGIAGIRLVNPGDYLKDGADIVNIEDIDAVFVDFRLPERFQNKLKRGQTALVDMDALPGRTYTAVVQAIDPLIDANGRSVAVRACIDNRQLQLRPGMFARVNAVFGERDNARVIPEEALVPQGDRQFVIKLQPGPEAQTWVARRVAVQVGIRRPGQAEITSGLEPGDMVVTTGQQRLQRDGMTVRVVDLSPPAAARSSKGASAAAPVAAAAAPEASRVLTEKALGGTNPCLVGMREAGPAPAVSGATRGSSAPAPTEVMPEARARATRKPA
ncbi:MULTISPECIES: efflux RND transporter periplasmic adaptor subunit [unclassified Polaromonas]|jgi:membrane fusion protein (multidrug efflux system)|uniref:efflux RND transporter periplasmic adaptor subunit n=1 Tax=unclassified Polaromonas TaxID=2638319 RepID=UPI000BCA9599|nr:MULTISPECIES: efflux RND transporter periplasmic adaptor subunit [unclassified Polaromonas]OYY36996.1 MAG: efflux transporter periplasmic adaptor subunit [Polaromonas sp. 35-63-35]OYZ20616.1 MAG: efflux transporter periplasmic adaptor subunit [Polaromonas sp. 16-63-31]OYZ78755.1 MAG: efflux transporter periplasmic adaptor subunit [Polaromonas sp. 24-63-21]OZA49732.1 MAG: efflux transporter periplasmic adaptor subunit [Polaromonas sp. 17-63-33]OZA89098.1 MAG: efflux transporter periplasmic a